MAEDDALERFINSVKAGDIDQVKANLRKVSSVDKCDKPGRTALIYACQNCHYEVAQFLISCGAKASFSSVPEMESPMLSAIHSFEGDPKTLLCVQLLLDNGADPNSLNRQHISPLIAAAGKGKPEVVKALLKAGARVEEIDSRGRTALHHAVSSRKLSICRALVEAGANCLSADRDARTPIDCAAQLKLGPIVEYFEGVVEARRQANAAVVIPSIAINAAESLDVSASPHRLATANFESTPIGKTNGEVKVELQIFNGGNASSSAATDPTIVSAYDALSAFSSDLMNNSVQEERNGPTPSVTISVNSGPPVSAVPASLPTPPLAAPTPPTPVVQPPLQVEPQPILVSESTTYESWELFLRSLNLEAVVPRFKEHSVTTMEQLLQLKDEDLVKMGIHQFGYRTRLLDGIHAFHVADYTDNSLPKFQGRFLNSQALLHVLDNMASHIGCMVSTSRYSKRQVCEMPHVLIGTVSPPDITLKAMVTRARQCAFNAKCLAIEMEGLQHSIEAIERKADLNSVGPVTLPKAEAKTKNGKKLKQLALAFGVGLIFVGGGAFVYMRLSGKN